MIRRRIEAGILAGLLYWILSYVIIKYDHLSAYCEMLSPLFVFSVLPLLGGLLLLLYLEEKHYAGLIYCILLALINDVFLYIADVVFLPAKYNLLEAVATRFINVGVFSWFFSLLGGLIAISLNKKRSPV